MLTLTTLALLVLLAAGLGGAVQASRQQQDSDYYPAADAEGSRPHYKEHSYYGDYGQHSRQEEEEMHRHHSEFDYTHNGDHYPKRSYPSHPSPSIKSCGGRLPPTVCTATTPRANILRRRPVPNDPAAACSSPGATYLWSPKCAEQTAIGGTCKGSSLCQPGDVSTAATATCTSDGWVVSDDCYPCREPPEAPTNGNFSTCQVPGFRFQACTAACDIPQPPAAQPPQVVCAPSCFTGGFWEYRGGVCYPPAVENVCEAGMPVSPDFNGLLNGTLYLRGSLRVPTEVLSDALAAGCGGCSDLYQPVAVFKLDASPTARNVTVSTCNITGIDTVLQVLHVSGNGGGCTFKPLDGTEDSDGRPGCSDDDCFDPADGFFLRQSQVDFTAAADTPYVVILYQFTCGAQLLPREARFTQTTI